MSDDSVRASWTLGMVLGALMLGFWIGRYAGKATTNLELPRFPWVKVGSTNTVTITNTVTRYVLDIKITESDSSSEWTNRTLLRYRRLNESKPFDADVVVEAGIFPDWQTNR